MFILGLALATTLAAPLSPPASPRAAAVALTQVTIIAGASLNLTTGSSQTESGAARLNAVSTLIVFD